MPDGARLPAKRKGGIGRNGGKPATYTKAIADEICDRVSQGESLDRICQDPRMPTATAVRLWVKNGREPFTSEYTRARELGYQVIAEDILEFGLGDVRGPDGYVDNGEIQRLRLLSENRKWFLSKMLPRQFGDKVTQEIVGNEDQPLITRIELVPVDPIRPKTIDHEPSRDDGNGDGSAIKGTSKL